MPCHSEILGSEKMQLWWMPKRFANNFYTFFQCLNSREADVAKVLLKMQKPDLGMGCNKRMKLFGWALQFWN